MDDEIHGNLDTIDLERFIGFNGKIWNGLKVHPNNVEIVYPLGYNVIIEEISTGKQSILSKHTNNVTSIAIDPTGKYLASGQVNFMGFKAPIIVWDYETRKPIMEKELHKVKIEALTFSSDSTFLISLGGRDCGAVVVWNVGKGEAVCGSPAQLASAGISHCLVASQVDPNMFVTGGQNTVRVWHLDAPGRIIHPTDCRFGSVKREVTDIQLVDHKSNLPFMFCGTASGDILGINTVSFQLQVMVPNKHRFDLGITNMSLISFQNNTFSFLVGTGDGLVGRYDLALSWKKNRVSATWKRQADAKPWTDTMLSKRSAVTSIAKRGCGHMFFVGTESCQIYKFNYADLSATLMKTCHSTPINDILFAFASSELIATCSYESVRVWNAAGQELCRYVVNNMTCHAICISRDGRNLFSGWDDNKVRVFGFQKEKDGTKKLFEKFTMRDTHGKGVTALAITACGNWLISGGGEGQVRLWQICMDPIAKTGHGDLVANMKEHEGKVTCIQVHPNDHSCVSASTDGSSIIWELKTHTRIQVMLSNTLFRSVCYGSKGLHILTAGSDHTIGYWDVLDGGALRVLEGAKTGSINTIDLSPDGNYFITGGDDRLLRMWRYTEGDETHVGVGHSDAITKARICPHRKRIVSCGADGAIHIWKYPSGI